MLTMCRPEVASLTFAAVFARFFRSEMNDVIDAIVHADVALVKRPWRRKTWQMHRCIRPAAAAQWWPNTPLFSFFGLPSHM